jgi:hypothetical protein
VHSHITPASKAVTFARELVAKVFTVAFTGHRAGDEETYDTSGWTDERKQVLRAIVRFVQL